MEGLPTGSLLLISLIFAGAYIGKAGQDLQNSLSTALAKKHVHSELLNEARFEVILVRIRAC